jgi:hypothetical protein
MDMDDDFMGEVEFNLTAEQSQIVSRAIDIASRQTDEFQVLNPLISIMQWWASSGHRAEKRDSQPEQILVEACRSFVLAHEKASPTIG